MTRITVMATLTVALMALVLAACGGGSAPDAGTDPVSPPVSAETAIVQRLGAEGGVDAALYAFERGYSADQVRLAGTEGTLSEIGTVAGAEPLGSALGLIELPDGEPEAIGATAIRTAVRVLQDLRPVDTVRASLLRMVIGSEDPAIVELGRDMASTWVDDPTSPEGAGAAGLALVFALADQGYSMDQIIEAIILGYLVGSAEESPGFGPCFTLFVPGGNKVPPVSPLSGCPGPEETAPEQGADDDPPPSNASTDNPTNDSTTYRAEIVPVTEEIIGYEFDVENSIVIERTGSDFSVQASYSYQFSDEGSPQCSGTTGFYFEGTATLDEESDSLTFEGTRRIVYDWQGSCAEQQSPEPNPQIYYWTIAGDTISGDYPGGSFTTSP